MAGKMYGFVLDNWSEIVYCTTCLYWLCLGIAAAIWPEKFKRIEQGDNRTGEGEGKCQKCRTDRPATAK